MSNRKTAMWEKETKHIREDAEGNITVDTTTESHLVKRSGEPDYIKIYTNMWCEFNGIPERVRPLFLQLAIRMSYCNSTDISTSQIVYTTGPNKVAIKKAIGITSDKVYYRYLGELVQCNAIKLITRGCYQINPQYAGRGAWRYNAKEKQGGIEDLIATFDFKEKTVKTNILWAEDRLSDSKVATEDLVNDEDQVVIKSTTIKNNQLPGQMELPKAAGYEPFN